MMLTIDQPSVQRVNTRKIQSPLSNVSAEIATFLANAKVLFEAGEYHMSLNLLRQACNRDSKNPKILRTLAISLDKCGYSEESILVKRALRKIEYNFENLFMEAQALYLANEDQEALHLYYEALSVLSDEHPSLFEIHKNMGNIFVRGGDYEGAEEAYNKAYRMNPNSDALMVNFGTLEIQRQDKGRALSCFRQAVEINPQNDRAWVGLAMIHQDFGDHELAWGNLERALDLNPGNRTAVLFASNWAIRDQMPWKAALWVQSYLSTVNSDEEMSLVLVNLFCLSGRTDLAELEATRILSWNPDRKDVSLLKNKLRELRVGK